MTTTKFPLARALDLTQARALIANVCARKRGVSDMDHLNAVYALGTLLGLDVYRGTGYDPYEGDHIVVVHRRREVFGHIVWNGETSYFWHH